MKALILDDEPKAQENLRILLTEYCPLITEIETKGNLADALLYLNNESIDLLFLDIQLGNNLGFEIFDTIKNPTFQTIVVTAYDDYALRAFSIAAIDYVLKPIDIDRLIEAVERVESLPSNTSAEQIKTAREHLKEEKHLERIVLHSADAVTFVKPSEIIRCESLDNYTKFFLTSRESILISKNIKHYETLLSGFGFYRVHRSHLVNTAFVKEFHKRDGGYIILKNGKDLPLSRRKRTEFLEFFNA